MDFKIERPTIYELEHKGNHFVSLSNNFQQYFKSLQIKGFLTVYKIIHPIKKSSSIVCVFSIQAIFHTSEI